MNKTHGRNGCPRLITSRSNPLIVSASSLSEKKYRDRTGCFAFEGLKLYKEAVASKVCLEHIFVREDVYDRFSDLLFSDISLVVSDFVYNKMSEEKSPEGILCVAKYIDFLHKKVKIYDNVSNECGAPDRDKSFFIVSQVRDPGNLGTIIRNANALGIDELIISADCADIYNPRTVRAAMGALFRQKITVCCDMYSAVEVLRAWGYHVMAAALSPSSVSITDIDVSSRTCFLVGNEGHGLDKELISACSGSVIIPMQNGSESLNAAAASAILMWESAKKHGFND